MDDKKVEPSPLATRKESSITTTIEARCWMKANFYNI